MIDQEESLKEDLNIFVKDLSKQAETIDSSTFSLSIFTFAVAKSAIRLTGTYRTGFIHILAEMGFRKRYLNNSDEYVFVRIRHNVMAPTTVDRMKTRLYNAFSAYGGNLKFVYNGLSADIEKAALHEVWAKNFHLIFNNNFLEHLPSFDLPELRDTKDKSFFLFQNCVVTVSVPEIKYQSYKDFGGYAIWQSRIVKRDFTYQDGHCIENTKFHQFFWNVMGKCPDRFRAGVTGLGYMLHSFNHSTMGQALILYDEKPTDIKNPSGGTGKGLIAQSVKQLKELEKIDGKHFDENDKFRYQVVNASTQVIFFDDMNAKTSYSCFFSILTDGMSIEKKHVKTIQISPECSPKMMFASNSILGGNGTSDKRRQYILELSDHYSSQIKNGTEKPIEEAHGIMFDRDWPADEWNRFYSFMLDCCRNYLRDGLQPYKLINVEKNKMIQSVGEDFSEWFSGKDFEFKEYNTRELFEEYKSTYDPDNDQFKQRSFSNLLKNAVSIRAGKCQSSAKTQSNTFNSVAKS